MFERIVKEATEHGNAIGQAALAEFIMKEYGTQIPHNLKRLLEKVTAQSYEAIGNTMDKPAEDIALQVHEVMHTRLG